MTGASYWQQKDWWMTGKRQAWQSVKNYCSCDTRWNRGSRVAKCMKYKGKRKPGWELPFLESNHPGSPADRRLAWSHSSCTRSLGYGCRWQCRKRTDIALGWYCPGTLWLTESYSAARNGCWSAGCSIWTRPVSSAIRSRGKMSTTGLSYEWWGALQTRRVRRHSSFTPVTVMMILPGNCWTLSLVT